MRRPGFEPWNLRVVVDQHRRRGLGRHRPAHRRRRGLRQPPRHPSATSGDRGLAQAILVDAFGEARAHGALLCGLSTDSRTGALGLYEKVGMTVTDVWLNRGITLG